MSVALVLPQKKHVRHRISRFHMQHVSQSVILATNGDVCKQTCKIDPPETCKLECHTGSPFADMQEEIPVAVA